MTTRLLEYLRQWQARQQAQPPAGRRWLWLAVTIACIVAAWATWLWAMA